jgi:RNA polymerase primary sigma factor
MALPITPTAPMTPAEETRAIVDAQAGDEAAMERLVRAQVRYVVGEARKMASATVSEDDLLQVGLSAFVQSVRAFDAARPVRLFTFAKAYIREAMNEERAAAGTPMAIPGRTLRRFEQARRATSSMDAAADFAADQGMDRRTFYAVAEALNGSVSIDAAHTAHAHDESPARSAAAFERTKELSLHEALQPAPAPEVTAVNRATVASYIRAAGLDTRAERIVRLAYGFAGEPLSDADIAKVTGLSRPTVGRIRNEALAALQRAAA